MGRITVDDSDWLPSETVATSSGGTTATMVSWDECCDAGPRRDAPVMGA